MGAAVPISVPADLPRRRLTVDDYHAMAEAGVLGEDDRVELIEGELIEMAPIGGGHMLGVNRLTHTLVHAVGDRAVVSVQNGLMLPPFSEPRPDLLSFT
jgi:Uma2 family endonuclease